MVPMMEFPVDGPLRTLSDAVLHCLAESVGLGGLPVCIAKTQYSLSDDPTQLGRPRDFHITVTDIRPSAGAGFVVVLTGDIMTMPGLPRKPAAEAMRVDPDGVVHGLF